VYLSWIQSLNGLGHCVCELSYAPGSSNAIINSFLQKSKKILIPKTSGLLSAVEAHFKVTLNEIYRRQVLINKSCIEDGCLLDISLCSLIEIDWHFKACLLPHTHDVMMKAVSSITSLVCSYFTFSKPVWFYKPSVILGIRCQTSKSCSGPFHTFTWLEQQTSLLTSSWLWAADSDLLCYFWS
jgi:hypothetical protein